MPYLAGLELPRADFEHVDRVIVALQTGLVRDVRRVLPRLRQAAIVEQVVAVSEKYLEREDKDKMTE